MHIWGQNAFCGRSIYPVEFSVCLLCLSKFPLVLLLAPLNRLLISQTRLQIVTCNGIFFIVLHLPENVQFDIRRPTQCKVLLL